MRAFGAVILAGLLSMGAAHAQVIVRTLPPGVVVASDLDGPYDDGEPDLPPPPRYAPSYPPRAYGPPAGYGPPPYGPTAYAPALPLHEIYRIVREGGYSPLGAPQQRGGVYTISVLDLDGEDGRLVIDARNGRIIRFMPAFRYGARRGESVNAAYGPPSGLPSALRPPAAISQARASVPLPKPRSAPPQPLPEKSAAIGASRPAVIPAAPPAALAAVPAPSAVPVPAPKSAVTLQPTQAMPPAQGVD